MRAALSFLAPALILALAAPAAAAPADRVVVTAQKSSAEAPRRDVDRVCPAIAAQLPETLASAWQHVGQEGTVRVQFTLEGRSVSSVQALSGPRRYARWVRSAMQDVDCRADLAQAQTFQFDLRFIHPMDAGAQGQAAGSVAVLLR